MTALLPKVDNCGELVRFWFDKGDEGISGRRIRELTAEVIEEEIVGLGLTVKFEFVAGVNLKLELNPLTYHFTITLKSVDVIVT